MTTALIIGGIVLGVALIALLVFGCFWKVAGTNEVLIVSGLGKVKTRTGGGLFVLPILQKTQKMTLENIQVDFTSRQEIPTKDAIHVLVDAVANMSISIDPARQAIAASKFAGYSTSQIRDIVIPVLEGNIREIISQTMFEDLIRGDKKVFAERIQENVTPNLADMGIDLTTFNIQNFSDKNGVIRDLGIENIEKIKKEASIAAAKAKAEVAVEQANADKLANDAKVAAATEIAQKQTEFAIRKAELQKQADTEQAKADAAKAIEAENQRREQEIATANANLARQEKEIELKEREVAIKEKALEAEIKKTAEAKKYAEQQAADAKLYATQKAAEADLFERQRLAEAAVPVRIAVYIFGGFFIHILDIRHVVRAPFLVLRLVLHIEFDFPAGTPAAGTNGAVAADAFVVTVGAVPIPHDELAHLEYPFSGSIYAVSDGFPTDFPLSIVPQFIKSRKRRKHHLSLDKAGLELYHFI